MKSLHFIAEKSPLSYPLNADTYLYNREEFLQLKEESYGHPLTFYALLGEVAVARAHFFLVKQDDGKLEAISIPASPFGSVEYNKRLTTENLTAFVSYIKHELIEKSAKTIIIKNHIAAYQAIGHADLHTILLDENFQIQEELVNHHIVVDRKALFPKMNAMEVRRVRKCQRAGFVSVHEPLSSLKKIYEFISECRAEKGWELSMQWQDIEHLVSLFPENYLLFTVQDQENIIAATIAVLVNDHVLYNFYPASRASYQQFSPMVMLTSALYQHCQQAKINLLDLGTSLTPGLQKFKQNMGGTASLKRTYQYGL